MLAPHLHWVHLLSACITAPKSKTPLAEETSFPFLFQSVQWQTASVQGWRQTVPQCGSTKSKTPLSSCIPDRYFAAAGPYLWNALPVQMRNIDITYRRQIKGRLFREAWTRRSVTFDMRRLRKTTTYLLTYLLTYLVIQSVKTVSVDVVWDTSDSQLM